MLAIISTLEALTTRWYFIGGILVLRAHCALLLDYVPPEEPLGTPLGKPLELGNPSWTGGDLEGDLPSS